MPGVQYPAQIDTFTVPSAPATTSLSSSGSSDRDHVESHRDLGVALTAVETNAALKTHDHSGVDDRFHGPKLAQSATHELADTDTALTALHHTLGTGANQSAAGNHNHDYNTLLNVPVLRCTSTTRPGTPTDGLMIYETDTRCMRIWGSFLQNTTVTGLDLTVLFTAPNSASLGTDWSQWYLQGDLLHGLLAQPSNNEASWIDNSGFNNTGYAQYINPAGKYTEGDDQSVIWVTGNTPAEAPAIFTNPSSNDALLRLSDDHNSYLRVGAGTDNIMRVLYTTTGSANEQELGRITNVTTIGTNITWQATVQGRNINIYRMGELIGTIVDKNAVSAKGANNRGWGQAAGAGQRGAGQTTPGSIKRMRISDLITYTSANRWTLLPVVTTPITRLRQVTAQQLYASGTFVEWGQAVEDVFSYWNSAAPTDIVIKEPGLYQIEVGIQWDPAVVPDTAIAVLCVNGVETDVRKQGWMRGDGFQPNFSQTLDIAGKLRFGPGDVLSVKVSYVASSGLLNFIFSFFDGPSHIKSRIDVGLLSV